MAELVPVPDNAALTIEDLGGASVGGGPWTITKGKSIATPLESEMITAGPYLTTSWQEELQGSGRCPFQLVIEPDMGVTAGTFEWNSTAVSQYWWFTEAWDNKSNLAIVYRPSSAAATTTNLQWTVHLRGLSAAPAPPGAPNTVQEYTFGHQAAYVALYDGASTKTWGTALT